MADEAPSSAPQCCPPCPMPAAKPLDSVLEPDTLRLISLIAEALTTKVANDLIHINDIVRQAVMSGEEEVDEDLSPEERRKLYVRQREDRICKALDQVLAGQDLHHLGIRKTILVDVGPLLAAEAAASKTTAVPHPISNANTSTGETNAAHETNATDKDTTTNKTTAATNDTNDTDGITANGEINTTDRTTVNDETTATNSTAATEEPTTPDNTTPIAALPAKPFIVSASLVPGRLIQQPQGSALRKPTSDFLTALTTAVTRAGIRNIHSKGAAVSDTFARLLCAYKHRHEIPRSELSCFFGLAEEDYAWMEKHGRMPALVFGWPCNGCEGAWHTIKVFQ